MRCANCGMSLSRFMGLVKTKAVICPNDGCDAAICVHCLPELVETREEGMGPLRRAVLEVYCPECEGVVHRQAFPSGLEQAARRALHKGIHLTHDVVVKKGGGAVRRLVGRGRH